MNEKGHVVTWQLTKGTSFSEIETLLSDLKERSPILKTIYIDDCCKLRQKLTSVFGEGISVKLDLFHATQRVTRTLRKTHPLAQQCMLDFRLVFREDGDSEDKRMCATPAAELILTKLNAFVEKWRNVHDNYGRLVFTADTIPATDKLKRHITKGCVSNIPPGAGTNRNEGFHKHIKPHFNRSRMGILLAYALLSVLIYAHNSATKVHGRTVISPLSSCDLKPIGIVPKVKRTQTLQNSSHWEIDVCESVMDMHVVVEVYTKSVKKHNIMKALENMGLCRLTDYVCSFVPYQLGPFATPSSCNLSDKPSDYGLKVVPAPPDGNCFFNAVAINIMAAIGVSV